MVAVTAKIYVKLFSFHENVLNFIVRNLTFEIMRKQSNSIRAVIMHIAHVGDMDCSIGMVCEFRTIAAKMDAAIGHDSPLKVFSDCSFVLKMASRNAVNAGINSEMNGMNLPMPVNPDVKLHRKSNISVPGSTPKETISHKESNSLPISDVAFSNLADNPSIRSKNAAMNMNRMPIPGWLNRKMKIIPMKPETMFSAVRRFGMLFRIECFIKE